MTRMRSSGEREMMKPGDGTHSMTDVDLRDGGEIWVDDVLLFKNGKFVIKF